jgi:hypothetical protein
MRVGARQHRGSHAANAIAVDPPGGRRYSSALTVDRSVEWLHITFHMYRKVFPRAAALAVKNWPVLGTVFAYLVILSVAATVARVMGFAGGFVVSLVWAACAGSFLYLVEMMVRTSRVSLDDVRRSFGAYLWDVVGVSFVFWVFFTLVTPAILQLPNGGLILLCINIAIFVLCNAVPELIYLGHHSALALLAESYGFVAANWLEWFPANMVAAAVFYAVSSLPGSGPVGIVRYGLTALLVYFTMVMRGLLFLELYGSTHRSRRFKYRAQF